jgi:aldose 1-epimerase
MTTAPFGSTAAGTPVQRVTLQAGELTVALLTHAAILQSVRLRGVPHDLTPGSDRLADYEGPMRFHGAIVGPVANRISTARVVIDGRSHELERNDGQAHLHSGSRGMHTRTWTLLEATGSRCLLSLALEPGETGLPGRRTVTACWELSAPATLRLTLTAQSDATTLMNLANHSYWNLDGTPDWGGHRLRIAAEAFLPCTPEFCPTGEIRPVAGTGMDLREGRVVHPGEDVLDHNFCLAEAPRALTDVLWLTGRSGVAMVVATTAPGLQLYDGRDAIRPGHTAHEGLAIEAQAWPDAPNNPGFPSIVLRAGEAWRQVTEWRFFRPDSRNHLTPPVSEAP